MKTFSLLGPTAKTSIDYKLHPKLYPYFSGPSASFSSKRMWIFFTERYKLSSILYAIRSISPAFSFNSALSFPFYTNSCPTSLIVVLIISSMACTRYYGLIPSPANWQSRRTESIVMTSGLPKRFFHGILILSPLMLECLMTKGKWYFCSRPFLKRRLLISILPENRPTLNYLESNYSMNSPSCYLRIF